MPETPAEQRAAAEKIVQKLIRDAAEERDGDWAVSFPVLPVRVFRAIDALLTREREAIERAAKVAESFVREVRASNFNRDDQQKITAMDIAAAIRRLTARAKEEGG